MEPSFAHFDRIWVVKKKKTERIESKSKREAHWERKTERINFMFKTVLYDEQRRRAKIRKYCLENVRHTLHQPAVAK